MSEYPDLIPIHASSTMHVTNKAGVVTFTNNMIYNYLDSKKNPSLTGYKEFLDSIDNYDAEISLYWENLQMFLDEEINKINGKEVSLNIQHCTIQFRDETHPFVQWIIEFLAPSHFGSNSYENLIEKERLLYPINSIYIFDESMIVLDVETSLNYEISENKHIIEYFGSKGETLSGYESIEFEISP
jgi:hypothetical protein